MHKNVCSSYFELKNHGWFFSSFLIYLYTFQFSQDEYLWNEYHFITRKETKLNTKSKSKTKFKGKDDLLKMSS